jgi:hypothetical protein
LLVDLDCSIIQTSLLSSDNREAETKLMKTALISTRSSLKIVIVVLFLVAVRNFVKLQNLALAEDGAIDEHNAKYSLSNSNTEAEDIEARRQVNKPLKNRKKHKKHKKQQNIIKLTDAPLKIPTPVLLASLPKSGTTSVWKYFMCGGQSASHLFAKVNETWSNTTVLGTGSRRRGNVIDSGLCMKWNSLAGRPLLKGCGDYDVWTDTGYVAPLKEEPACYYPAIEGLDDWFKSYPNSTIMLITRSVDSWVSSVSKWKGGSLVRKWHLCHLSDIIESSNRTKSLTHFYEWQLEHIRDFARTHPSITYIEAALEDPNIASILHAKTGIPSSCWGDCKPENRHCKAKNETSVTR